MKIKIKYFNLPIAEDFGYNEKEEIVSLGDGVRYKDLLQKLMEKFKEANRNRLDEKRAEKVFSSSYLIYSNSKSKPVSKLVDELIPRDEEVVIWYWVGGG